MRGGVREGRVRDGRVREGRGREDGGEREWSERRWRERGRWYKEGSKEGSMGVQGKNGGRKKIKSERV